jgi:hypothetical protein
LLILHLLVSEAMNDSVSFKETRRDDVEVRSVCGLIPAKRGVCNMIRKLHNAGRSGVNKQRRICDVALNTPLGSELTELLGKSLESGFVRALETRETRWRLR